MTKGQCSYRLSTDTLKPLVMYWLTKDTDFVNMAPETLKSMQGRMDFWYAKTLEDVSVVRWWLAVFKKTIDLDTIFNNNARTFMMLSQL